MGAALGFPLGQSLQAFHAWNLDLFRTGVLATLDPLLNWWNFMETTFGAVMGAALGLGLWLNRQRISAAGPKPESCMSLTKELSLLVAHVILLVTNEFLPVRWLSAVYNYSLAMGLLPMVGVASGRRWPYWMVLPVAVLPIAGKTLRQLAYREPAIPVQAGWLFYFVLPMLVSIIAAHLFARSAASSARAANFLHRTLLLTTWLFFVLNFAFFRYPWPWSDWTSRTPNAVVYTMCAVGLTLLANEVRRQGVRQPA
jgi:hypothetical protein